MRQVLQQEPETASAVWKMSGRGPLHHAIATGDSDICELLIDAGVAVGAVDLMGRTPIHFLYTAPDDRHVSVAKLLTEHGARPSAKDKRGLTPLHLAAWLGDVKCARALMGVGGDANAKTLAGRTPLHFAASGCFPEMAAVLLAQGGQVNARDETGRTPLHMAAARSPLGPHKESWDPKASVDVEGGDKEERNIVYVLGAAGADVSAVDRRGDTALRLALRHGHSPHFSPHPAMSGF